MRLSTSLDEDYVVDVVSVAINRAQRATGKTGPRVNFAQRRDHIGGQRHFHDDAPLR